MTNLSNSSQKTKDVKESTRFEAHQLLTEHYPHLSQLFLHQYAVKSLEFILARTSLNTFIDSIDLKSKCQGIKQHPHIMASMSDELFNILDRLLDEPLDTYEVLKQLIPSINYENWNDLQLTNTMSTIEDLRSFFLEAHFNEMKV